jgi:UDP-N-acetylglucosamine--N-acetylmuramyl-(pentapeptide) pyrophosphoryl-undecaprenol N-acetylglucosamine transferase
MRLVVTGGGTGGHIYPALAVAECMQQMPDVEAVVYIGKQGGLESELAPQNSIPFEGVSFYGMPRGLSPGLPFRLLKWVWSLRQARESAKEKLRQWKPDVVFGTGGYVSAPVLLAAKSLGIPYVLHEPDAHPGLANRFMAKGAQLITTSFTEGADTLRQRPDQEVLVTGNPIRRDIGGMPKAQAQVELNIHWPEGKTVLLVTGGSQGARRLNQAVVEALPTLLNELDLAVLHVTGKKLYEETLTALDERDPNLRQHPFYRHMPYSAQMPALLTLADIAICRAGSLSLSEMYVCGIPTILVPYPYAAADHQRKNALASVRSGASRMIEDADCTGSRLTDELRTLLHTPNLMDSMRQSARALGHPNATADIVACLQRIAASS